MRIVGFLLVAFFGFTVPLSAQQPPSYAKQVRPVLAKYCSECHNSEKAKGDYDTTAFKLLLQGGAKGVAIVPGKPDESPLVTRTEHKTKAFMPPAKSTQPTPEEIAVLRAWVAAGGKDDSTAVLVKLPTIQPDRKRPAPIAALAYRPDGKTLVAGGYHELLTIDPNTGNISERLPLPPSPVTAIVFSRDGQRLALATGKAGEAAEILLFNLTNGKIDPKTQRTIRAHTDVVYGLAFSPDGNTIASTGYDRLIKLWSTADGKELQILKDHSDTVYGLTFSPNGKLLASAAADRAVKVWDIETGKRLYTLSDSTDWVYSVTWSPNGKHLAAAGVDRSIRIWEVNAEGGKLVHSTFAHEASVLRLVYSSDGKTLYSLSEDRSVKSWDTATMVEKKVYAKQPETPLALAVPADGKQIALGRYDGAIVLLDEATGQVQAQPLPAKPKPPVLNKLTPKAAPRGQTVRVTFEGTDLDGVSEIVSSAPNTTVKLLADGRTATSLQADITLAADIAPGSYQVSLKGTAGQTAQMPFSLDRFPAINKQATNDSAATAQRIELPVTVAGSFDRAGAVDFYRFEAKAGQQVGVQVAPGDAGKLDPILQLLDAHGKVQAEGNSALGYTCTVAGNYALSVRDRDYRPGPLAYRLHIGDVPVITAVFPLGLQRGTEVEVKLHGVHLGGKETVKVKAAADAVIGSRIPLGVQTPLGAPLGGTTLVVGEFPEVQRDASADQQPANIPVPGTGNGVLDKPRTSHVWRFDAKKGQRLILEVNARRLGSPLDSVIEVLDTNDKPVPRAVLRCLAKTFTTLRDHDSQTPGIRMETWNEFAINDYVLIGNELLRIFTLPRNPDDDCQFYAVNRQRVGQFDTTPAHHAFATPMYRVSIHPPGTTFPPNGFPVVTLYYRNDDGGPGYGKDSCVVFDPPADDTYRVRITDSRGDGGQDYAYRLTVRPPRPSFEVRFNPTSPTISRGSALPINVTADRTDGFDGPIDIRVENLPPGFHAPQSSIPVRETTTDFALFADATAPALAEKAPPLKLIARAKIDGQEVVREVTGGLPKLIDPGDIVTSTEQAEVTVKPGQSVWITAKIERRNGFAGRVPLEVRGLPQGIRVLDVGLNGILVTEKDTSRRIEIYCEPWVEPTQHPFVVLAKREGKGTDHAAKSVLLRVEPK